LKGTATQIPKEKALWLPKLPQREEAISKPNVKQKLLQFELMNVPENINEVPSKQVPAYRVEKN
jgi:hypothetical protein